MTCRQGGEASYPSWPVAGRVPQVGGAALQIGVEYHEAMVLLVDDDGHEVTEALFSATEKVFVDADLRGPWEPVQRGASAPPS